MVVSLLLGLAMLQGGAPDTDTTVTVSSGARLALSLANGEVRIRTWDRHQVRVEATHSSRTTVEVHTSGAVVRVEARGRMGMPGATDFTLTVPVWMSAELDGMSLDVDAEAMRGALKVGGMNGDVTVRNGGDLDIAVINGDLIVEGAEGRLSLSTVSGQITATDARGDINAEAISGSIGLYRIESNRVVAESVSGEVLYQGTVQNGGSYVISSHSGSVTFGMPANANATVNSATMSGSLSASFTLPSVEVRSRSRRMVRFGTGSARIDLESFSGRVRLVRPNEVPAQQGRREGRSQDDRFDADGWAGDMEFAFDVLRDLDLSGLASLANIGVRVDVRQEVVPEFDWAFDMRFLRGRNLDLKLRRDRSRSEPPSSRLER